MSVLDPSGLVLAGVIPDNAERLFKALSIPAQAFGGVDRRLFEALVSYYRSFQAVMPPQALARRITDEDAQVRTDIAQRWVQLRDAEVDDDQFEWARSTLFEDHRTDRAVRAITTAGRILGGGHPVPNPADPDNPTVKKGYGDMREYLQRELAALDGLSHEQNPEGELRDELQLILGDYGSVGRHEVRFATGIPQIDEPTSGGPRAGQMWFVAAYAGEGKTTFATTIFAYQAMLQGLNVVYITGETLREDIRRRLVARHTRASSFAWSVPGGVSLTEIIEGRLPPDHLRAFHEAANDLTEGSREGRYGRLMLAQMPLRNHFDTILADLARYESLFPVHVLIVDSIDMVRAKGVTYRDQISATIEDFASLAIAYARGRGLIVISPYQVNRSSYESAIQNSATYELSSLSETAMAERRASVVLSLLRLRDMPGQLRAQILKNRSGPVGDFVLELDDRSSYIGPVTALSAANVLDLIA